MSLKSARFFGLFLCTAVLNIRHKFSMGLRSDDWLGHERTLILLFANHSVVNFAVCLGSFSCWKIHLRRPGSFLRSEAASAPVSACSWNYQFFHQWCGVPLYMDSKTATHHEAASSLLLGRERVLGIIGSPWFPPNTTSFVLAEKFNIAFIGPYNPFPKLNSFVMMVFGKR